MALAVVPAGLVTLFRRMAGCSPVSMAYNVDPEQKQRGEREKVGALAKKEVPIETRHVTTFA